MSREINGFLYKRKHIAINKNIDWYEKRFTVCHELSHMILGHTCEDKYCEREADQNAFEMLVSDSELLEELEKYQGDTMILEKVL
jgi:Zn-dependent peptidase ImmA (M78 family)